MINQVHFGDCRDSLRMMAAAGVKVQMCVTSPPYFGLRDYGHEGQIGLEETPEQYIAKLVEVFRCVREVLADDGTLFINIGDSYFGAGARRAAPCDTSDKEPASSQASDCLCGSLCDACRKAYRIGISRIGSPLAPMRAPSPSESTREHTEAASAHPPTSGSQRQGGRTSSANQDQQQVLQSPVAERCAVPASTTGEFSLRPQGECSPEQHQAGECLLCERSLQHCAPPSERMEGCNCDTSQRESESRTAGKGVLGSAYQYSTTASLKHKDLIGIPWMLAFALRADGWYLRQEIIWHKPNPMPESVTDRCTKAHESLFLLSKSPRYYFDHEAIKEPAVSTSPAGNKTHKYSDAYAAGNSEEHRTKAGLIALAGVEWETRNRRSVWSIATRPYKGAHFAVFPPDLVEPCILAGSRPGGAVLDPFMGSGTTAAVAIAHDRQFIGCELNADYKQLQDERIENAKEARAESAAFAERMAAQGNLFEDAA